jgi:hypothetical protein
MWLWRPSVRRYNWERVSLCTLRKQPLQQTRVRWGDFPLIPNSIISHQVYQKKSRGRSVMPRGLRTTRQIQQHLCQTKPQPRRRRNQQVGERLGHCHQKKAHRKCHQPKLNLISNSSTVTNKLTSKTCNFHIAKSLIKDSQSTN